MFKVVFYAVGRKFATDRAWRFDVRKSAFTLTESAALYHKSFDHAVEAKPVVKPRTHEVEEIIHAFGRALAEQLEVYRFAVIKFYFYSVHNSLLFGYIIYYFSSVLSTL